MLILAKLRPIVSMLYSGFSHMPLWYNPTQYNIEIALHWAARKIDRTLNSDRGAIWRLRWWAHFYYSGEYWPSYNATRQRDTGRSNLATTTNILDTFRYDYIKYMMSTTFFSYIFLLFLFFWPVAGFAYWTHSSNCRLELRLTSQFSIPCADIRSCSKVWLTLIHTFFYLLHKASVLLNNEYTCMVILAMI